MAWPKLLADVECVGFDKEALPYLFDAIENDRVDWLETSNFAEYSRATFDYLGFRYELDEVAEIVVRISKIAKVDDDDDEDAAENLAEQQKSIAYGDWGSF